MESFRFLHRVPALSQPVLDLPFTSPSPVNDGLLASRDPGTFGRTSTKSSKTRRHISLVLWEKHKDELRRLYIDMDHTLQFVMTYMETERGFMASEKLYKNQFKAWGFQKNITQNQLIVMYRLRSQRAALGMPTAFEFNGKPLDLDERLKGSGIGSKDIHARFYDTTIEPLPTAIRVHTPHPVHASPCTATYRNFLGLKESLFKCAHQLPFRAAPMASEDSGWIEHAWSLGLGFSLFSRGHPELGNKKCGAAFDVLHRLVSYPAFDSLMYFLFIPLVWPDLLVTEKLWEYLSDCQSDTNDRASAAVRKLFNVILTLTQDKHGGNNRVLDALEVYIGDLLIHLSNRQELGDHRWPITKSDILEWSQDMALFAHFARAPNENNSTPDFAIIISKRAFSLVARCLAVLPTLPKDASENPDPIWQQGMVPLFNAISSSPQHVSDPCTMTAATKLLEMATQPTTDKNGTRDEAYFVFYAHLALAAHHKARWDIPVEHSGSPDNANPALGAGSKGISCQNIHAYRDYSNTNEEGTVPIPDLHPATSHMREAASAVEQTTSLSRAVTLEIGFVVDMWDTEAGFSEKVEKAWRDREDWVLSLDISGHGPRLT